MPRQTARQYYQEPLYGFPLFSPKKSKSHLLSCDSIRISDEWSFLSYTIKVSKDPATGRLFKQKQQKYLMDLLEQAEYFYKTAQTAPIKSQPLLYYYSFMNLVKIVINLNNYQGNTVRYVHGISDSISATSKLNDAEITLRTSSGSENSISESLISVLEDPRPQYSSSGRRGSYNVKISDLLRDCVGISRTYSETYNTKEHFLELELDDFSFYSQGNKLCLDGMVHGCNDVIMSALVSKGYNIMKLDDLSYLWRVDTYVRSTPSPTVAERHSLSKKMRSLGLWSYTNGDDYKLYISPKALRMSTPSIIYHAMFFFGSITRYHPDLFDSILTAKEYWMVSEFLKTQPKQFLYHILSIINGAEVKFSKQVQ